MNVFARLETGFNHWLARARNRSEWFDHLWRAQLLYGDVLAGRLAAAIAYYGFFAVFALALVGYWVFGAILGDNEEVGAAVADFLRTNLPFLEPAQIRESSARVGVLGVGLLVFTGIAWVEAIRSSQRLLYGFNQQPGLFGVRQLVDLAVLVLVLVLLGVSVGAVDALRALLRWLVGPGSTAATVVSWVLTVPINMVLATALLAAVPRLRISARRLLPSVLVVALGILLINTLGRLYVVRWERNPAYAVVAGAVGLLLYLYLLNQLLLFGAALAATSRHGRIMDLTEPARQIRAEDAPPDLPGDPAGQHRLPPVVDPAPPRRPPPVAE